MYALQLSTDIELKAINSKLCIDNDVCSNPSFACKYCLTSLNTYSIGFISGEYGGRNFIIAPAAVIVRTTESTWWIEALSITTTEYLVYPSNGYKSGNNCGLGLKRGTEYGNGMVYSTNPSTNPSTSTKH